MRRFVLDVLTILFRFRLVLLHVAILFAIAFFWAEDRPSREYGFGGRVLHGFFGVQT